MSISVLLCSFGAMSLLLGVVKTIGFINKNKQFEGYKTTRGCVVEHISCEGHINFDDEEFGYDVINYDENDHTFFAEEGINTTAGIVEFVVKDRKYRMLDSVSDTNLMPIGHEVIVKYNPRKMKDAFIVEEFDGIVFYIVGVFLTFLGVFIQFFM